MRTLIVYATKHGFTQNCVEALVRVLDEKADVFDLGSNRPDPSEYDTVIIGGSVYMGKIRKPVARFCAKNLNTLKEKKLGLFICGLAEGADIQKEIEASFPEELLAVAVAKESFGGGWDYDKLGFMERSVMKKVTGTEKNQTRVDKANIKRFAQQMNTV